MYSRLASLPLFVLLMAIGSVAMIVPSIHAIMIGNHVVSRVFFYWMVLFLILTTLIAITASGSKPRSPTRSHLSTLIGAYLFLPAMLAVPFFELTRSYGFLSAWFEMVSSFTTTGATTTVTVYVDGEEQEREVEAGVVGDSATEILSGLVEGEDVVTTGGGGLSGFPGINIPNLPGRFG